ncbi:MAG: O-antigen ligase family protein [Planctomycetota bacterium]
MTQPGDHLNQPGRRLGVWLQSIAVILLLAVSAGRCFVAELPHRSGAMEFNVAGGASGSVSPTTDRSEWARAGFATLLLAGALLGAVGIALDRRTPLPPHWLIVCVAILGGAMAVSTAAAGDRRTAQLVYIEQMSLLITGVLAGSLLIPSRRRRWAVVAMVSAGLALAAKGYLQLIFDIPDRIAEFQQDRERYLWMLNATEGSPKAKLIEARVTDQAPTGFLSLANIYASMLLIPLGAGAGMAAGALRQAVRRDRTGETKRKPGHIDNSIFAAGLLCVAVGLAAVMLVLTRSRGAVGAAAVAIIGSVAAWKLGGRIIRNRRRWAVGALGAMAAAVGALLAWGSFAEIPVKTLAFRRQYWLGAWRVWMANLWTGVGGGNFQSAYLQHRLIGAEEAVQLPHNVFFGAVSQFGLGGLLLVVVAAWLAIRPTRATPELPRTQDRQQPPRPGVWVMATGVVLAAAVARTVFFDWFGAWAVWVWEVGSILLFLAVAAVLVAQVARRWEEDAPLRWGLRAGLVAFLLHNLVSYSFWTPQAAGWFWLTAGMLVAMGRRSPTLAPGDDATPRQSQLRWILPAVIGILLVFPAIEALRAATLRTWTADRMLNAYTTGRGGRAIDLAWERMKLDPRDPLAAATAAKIALGTADRSDEADVSGKLALALQAATIARQRDPAGYQHAETVAVMRWFHTYPDMFVLNPQARSDVRAIRSLQERADGASGNVLAMHDLGAVYYSRGEWAEALQWWAKVAAEFPNRPQARLNQASAAWLAGRRDDARDTWQSLTVRAWPGGALEAIQAAQQANPTDARMWLRHAKLASIAGDVTRTNEWIDRAFELSDAIDPSSVYRLSDDERARAEMLRQRAAALARERQTPAVIGPREN